MRPSRRLVAAPARQRPRRLSRPTDHDLLERMPDGVVVCDAAGRIVFVNDWVERETGYSRHELLGKPVEVLVPARLRSIHRGHRRQYGVHPVPRPMGNVAGDFNLRRKDGTELPTDIALAPLESGGEVQIVAVIHDITERLLLEAALAHEALHDPLTDLANRTLFFDRLTQAIASGRRDRKPLALVMLDLDRFKSVNDALGHAAGDRVLEQVAARLGQELRATDTVARLGGDEFAWIVSRVGGRPSIELLVRKRMRQVQRPISIETNRIKIAMSAGIAIYPDDGQDVDTLVRHADSAMYSAKRGATGLAFFVGGTQVARRRRDSAC